MKPTPILFISDAPDLPSGLGRVTRDLATLLTRSPLFRVGVLGWGMTGARSLPFACYAMQANEWGERSIQRVWADFARDQPGVVFTIWDISRLLWLTQPQFLTDEHAGLRAWLQRRPFQIWSYLPIDSEGVGGKLTAMSRDALLGVDRVLAYTPFGENVVRRTIGEDAANARRTSWMPHGLAGETWHPKTQDIAVLNALHMNTREHAVVEHTSDSVDETLAPAAAASSPVRIGVVATNQPRKDFGLAAAVCAAVRARIAPCELRLWWHVDQEIGIGWSIPALLADFGLTAITEVTTYLTDTAMAEHYRACDVTLGIGAGEGFGFTLFESLMCGVPCVHGDYAGGASIMSSCRLGDLLVAPHGFRLETQHNCYRPNFRVEDWVNKIVGTIYEAQSPEYARYLTHQVEHLQWSALWPRWRHWFEDGLR